VLEGSNTMEQSIGRATEPTTEAGAPDAYHLIEVLHHVRDVPPARMREDTGMIDLDELQRSIDPLDPRSPGRPTNDPLDPDGHVI
jgi:hypothetical protein